MFHPKNPDPSKMAILRPGPLLFRFKPFHWRVQGFLGYILWFVFLGPIFGRNILSRCLLWTIFLNTFCSTLHDLAKMIHSQLDISRFSSYSCLSQPRQPTLTIAILEPTGGLTFAPFYRSNLPKYGAPIGVSSYFFRCQKSSQNSNWAPKKTLLLSIILVGLYRDPDIGLL